MSTDSPVPRIAAVVPTIDPANLERAIGWLALLQDRGVTPVVAANSAATAALPLPEGFIRSMDGTNGGFAHSINRGARDAGDWDWLMLLNDDLQLTEPAVRAMVGAMRDADPDRSALLLFDPEPPRTVPTGRQALLALTLLWEIPARLRRAETALPLAGVLAPGTFKSFSAVAISRASWTEVGTLSERFLFCYEDAEYARRFTARGGVARSVPIEIDHNRSKSTKSRIRLVLPAIASSATAYMRSTGTPEPIARLLVAGALVARVPTVFVASAPRGEHLHGIAAGIRNALTGRAASLPPFDPSQPAAPVPVDETAQRRARIAAFAERCVEEGRGGMLPWLRRPKQAFGVLADSARLPQLTAGPFTSAGGAAVRHGLERKRPTRTPLDEVTGVLVLPATLDEYVQTPSRRPLRRKVRVAHRSGVTWRPVADADEQRRLVALADERERNHPNALYRRTTPSNTDLFDHDLWLVAEDVERTPLLVAVIPVAGEWAVLRYFRTLSDGQDATVARYLLTEALVGELIARGVRYLADTESPFVLPNGLRHFQRMVGYELYRVRRRRA